MTFIPRPFPTLTVRDDDLTPTPSPSVAYPPNYQQPASPQMTLGVKLYIIGALTFAVLLILYCLYRLYTKGDSNEKKKTEAAKGDLESQRDRSSSVSSEATLIDETAANTAANARTGKAGEKPSLRITIPTSPPRVKTYPYSHGYRADFQGRHYNAQEAILPPIDVRRS